MRLQLDSAAKPEQIGKWLTARKFVRPRGRKTDIWMIEGDGGSFLGRIAWYGPWRTFAFFPRRDEPIILEAECMRALANFCTEMRAARKKERANA